MKKAIAVLTTLMLVLTMLLPCNAAGVAVGGGGASGGGGGGATSGGTATPSTDRVVMQFSDVTIQQGTENVSVDLFMNTNDGCTSIRLEVVYDDEVFTLIGTDDGGTVSGANHSNNYVSPYILSWENDYAKENITSTGKLTTLNFTVDKDAPVGNYPIQVKNSDVLNTDIKDLECYVIKGFIRITAPEPKLEISNYAESGSTASFDVSLTSPDSISGTLIVAVYDENGTMLSLKPYAAFETIDGISVDITKADHINIMWWNMSNINPFTGCEFITIG